MKSEVIVLLQLFERYITSINVDKFVICKEQFSALKSFEFIDIACFLFKHRKVGRMCNAFVLTCWKYKNTFFVCSQIMTTLISLSN